MHGKVLYLIWHSINQSICGWEVGGRRFSIHVHGRVQFREFSDAQSDIPDTQMRFIEDDKGIQRA